MSRRKAGPAMARGAVQKRTKPEVKPGNPWVIEWRGWKGFIGNSLRPNESVVYLTIYLTNSVFLTEDIQKAFTWPTRAAAALWAKKHYRNRSFGDPSWKELVRFVEIKQ